MATHDMLKSMTGAILYLRAKSLKQPLAATFDQFVTETNKYLRIWNVWNMTLCLVSEVCL
jgi:hypothetical protein